MADTPSTDQMALLTQVIRNVTHVNRMTADDAQDFAQYVHLKLLERSYDVFDRFAGASSLKTYLTVVVSRLRLDWQRSILGKWRPSAMAMRLGAPAIELDRLIHRDGHGVAEAVGMLHARTPAAADDLWRLASRLRPNYRRQFIGEAAIDACTHAGFEDPVECEQRKRAAAIARRELRAALNGLSADDRNLLSTRFGRQQTLQAVARARHENPKVLYRRCERILRQLRRRLERAGVTGPGTVRWEALTGTRRRAASRATSRVH